jgi:hypothetical protein
MRVIVSVLNSAVVHMQVLMGLPVMAVLMRVLHMIMLMPNVRMRVRHIFM